MSCSGRIAGFAFVVCEDLTRARDQAEPRKPRPALAAASLIAGNTKQVVEL
jgi:hypothetical protein